MTASGISAGTREAERRAPGFGDFFAEAEPNLRRALVAAYGPERGRAATSQALAWAWCHWPELQSSTHPVGVLYRMACQEAGRASRADQFPSAAEPEEPLAPGLGSRLAELSESERVAVTLGYGFGWTFLELEELTGDSAVTAWADLERGLVHLRRAAGLPEEEALASQLRTWIERSAAPIAMDEVTAVVDGGPAPSTGRSPGVRAWRGGWWAVAVAVTMAIVGLAVFAIRSNDDRATVARPERDVSPPSPASYVEDSSRQLGLKVGDPCPTVGQPSAGDAVVDLPASTAPTPRPPMDAILAGDQTAGTCRVVAWLARGDIPGVAAGFYRQDGTLMWDAADQASKPVFSPPPDEQASSASQPSMDLDAIEAGVPFQRPVNGPLIDGSFGYIGTSTCVVEVTDRGRAQRCYDEQLTADALRPTDPTE